MPDSFANALLAALNDSVGMRNSQRNLDETQSRTLAQSFDDGLQLSVPQVPEHRFAEIVGSCMEKIRSGA